MNLSRAFRCLLSARPALSTHVRRNVVRRAMTIAAMCAALLAAAAADAQTAHFSGAIRSIGSGFAGPEGVAVDGAGNVFVADTGNGAIKEIVAVNGKTTSSSTVRTLATGLTPTGVAVDNNGNVFVANYGGNDVKQIVAVAGTIPASPTIRTLGSGFNLPVGVAVDATGNVFVTNFGNSTVQEMLAVAGSIPPSPIIRTLGSGFISPRYIDVDADGNVFVTDASNSAVKEIVAVAGSIPTSSPTIRTLANSSSLFGLALSGSGDVLFTNQSTNTIRRIIAVAGTIPSTPTIVTLPGTYQYIYDVALGSTGNVYVAQGYPGNSIKVIDMSLADFDQVAIATTTPPVQAISFTFDTAGTIAAPAVLTQGAPGLDFTDAGTGTCIEGTTYTAGDTCTVDVTFKPRYPGERSGAVQLKTTGGATIATAYVTGTGVGPQAVFLPGSTAQVEFGYNSPLSPFQTAIDGAGNLFVSNSGNSRILKVAPGTTQSTVVNTGSITFGEMTGIVVDGAGNLFVADRPNRRIVMVPPTGSAAVLNITGLATPLTAPSSLAIDGSGVLYIIDGNSPSRIVKVSLNAASLGTGSPTGTGSVLATHGSYDLSGSTLYSIAVDSAGTVYVSDVANRTIAKVATDGEASPVSTGSIVLYNPRGVVIDAAGNLYITDDQRRIVQVTAGGATYAWDISSLGDGPFSLTLDHSGYLYVSSYDYHLVIKVDGTPAGNSLSFPNTAVGYNSAAQTLILQNSGNAALSFDRPSPSGNNPSISPNFTLNSVGSTACPLTTSSSSTPGTLASGYTCDLPIRFAPQSVGSIAGSLIFTDNHLNATPSATQTIALTGTGVTPLSAVVNPPTSYSLPLGQAASFTPVTGSGGTTPYTYSISPTLPTGLVLNASTGTITGTPTANSPLDSYSVTVTDASNLPAPGTFMLEVTGTAPTINFSVANHTFGDAAFRVEATSNSTGAITYSVVTGPATITGNTVSLTGAGSVTLKADQAATSGFTSGSATATFSVAKADATLAFDIIPSKTYGDGSFNVNASSASTGSVTYSVVNGPATISGNNTVSITGAGTITLQADQAATTDYNSAATTTTVLVAKANPTLAFAAISPKTYGDAPFGVSATSASNGAVTYSVTGGPGGITGSSTVSITGAGTIALQAEQAASANYNAATATTTVAVAKANPTLAFATIPSKTFGDAPFDVSATSASDGAVTYSVVNGPATNSGSTITINGAGAITLRADQAASANYNAANTTTILNVAKADVTLAFTSIPAKTYGDAPFTVSASSASTTAVTYSVANGPASIIGNTVTLNGAGTVTLQADQPASTNYNAAVATIILNVDRANTTLTFAAIPQKTYGDAPFGVGASSASTGAVTYSVVNGPAAVSGSNVTLNGAGTVTLQADQAASTNYNASSAQVVLNVAKANPTLAFATIPSKTYGDAPFTVSAASASTGAVTYSVISGPATVNGSSISITGAGAVTLQAEQAATTDYNAASTQVIVNVQAAQPSLAFAVVPTRTYGDAPFAINATSDSSAPITYALVSGPATLAGNLVSITGAGTITVSASQPALGNYAASTVSYTITVNKAVPRITYDGLGNGTYPGSPITVTATSPSTGAVTLTATSGPANPGPRSYILIIDGAGTVHINASVVGDANYLDFTSSVTFSWLPAQPTLTFAPIAPKTYGDAPFAVSASSASTGAITYSVASGPAVISGNTISITGAGAVSIVATQAATTNYLAATTTATVNVAPAQLVVTAADATRFYGSLNPGFSATVTGARFNDSFPATASSTATSTSPVGNYSIVPAVSSPALSNYALTVVNGTLSVIKAPTTTTINVSSSTSNSSLGATFTAAVAPSLTSGIPTGTVTFLDNGVTLRTATLTAGTAVATAPLTSGNHTITAVYSGDSNFTASTSTGAGAGIVIPQLDFTITGPENATMLTASSMTVRYVLTPTYGLFPGPVSLTISGLPNGASYNLSQTAVEATAGQTIIALTLQTFPVIVQTRPDSRVPWSLAFFLVPLLGARRMRRLGKGVGRSLLMLAIMLATAAGLGGLSGCGAGLIGLDTQDYTVTLRATSGNVQRTSTMVLTVNRAPVGKPQ